jgi:hypothetical protein
MAERLLIAGGCSYTDKNFKTYASDFEMPEETWPMWPEHLAKRLGLKDINVGKCGNDNFTIFKSVLKAITLHGDKVDTVVVLWTGWDRSLLFNVLPMVTLHAFYTNLKDESGWSNPSWMRESRLDETIHNYLNSNWWDPPSFIRDSVNNSLSLMYTLAEICESKNIKYVFYQGVEPMATGYINLIEDMIKRPSGVKYNITETDILNHLKKCPFAGKLEERKDKLIGWPFIRHIGGHFLDTIRHHKKYFPEGSMNISNLDKHPNDKAQPIIANLFYERWKDLYGKD